MSKLGDRIRIARVQAGVTQAQLERETKIPVNSLSRIENGRYLPSVDALGRIAEALGVSMDELARDAAPDVGTDATTRRTLREMRGLSPKFRLVVLHLARSLRGATER